MNVGLVVEDWVQGNVKVIWGWCWKDLTTLEELSNLLNQNLLIRNQNDLTL